ncbi:LysR family transcriptional regulator [Klebsiella pasteurii]|uniref:LysR family transcriptional regulator n=1 Tax=Klebsiella pasteurii TaxID=2587529 RepID=A0ABT5CNG9_9ENTR|nr:LysR family transcriptional regulator [Klebsiella pasteurii]MBG2718514.1 LysR family transcriptional regulator [Klebsiella michiganensis]MDC0693081.1 LysR family transcriptional regulator [Klebsiella pasteurii]MDC0754978.1 LysR family transcriptional regulator [Klebsiella pasteurii]MDQ2167707.1 LysR family transcriptional regulator [Klebsiella pasteurii]MDQ2201384.1 LysR family transcriptional regulator [Klebsiella pasteurii]
MINSDDLRFFHAIATHKTLASTARALDISPSSVTQRLQGIEARLGVKLIQRPSRIVSLTDEGSLVLTRAEKVIAELNELQQIIDNRQQQVTGKLRVLAPLGFGNEYVAPLLAKYAQMHPHIEAELTLSDVPNWSSKHLWDVIVYIGELRDSSLHRIKLASNKRVVCASPAYLSIQGEPETPEALKHHTCIALRENDEDVTLWRFSREDVETPVRIHPRMSSNDGNVVKKWALAGCGIIMRSEWDVTPQINAGTLVRILADYQLPDASIVALSAENAGNRPPRAENFIQLLKTSLALRPWRRLSAV